MDEVPDPDVLPAWVAEMDFALALPIREVLQTAIARDDTGYADVGRLGDAFAGFAASRFGWEVDPARVRLVADVMSAVAELLRFLVGPDDRVVINPPVYPPFFLASREVGCSIVEVPLVEADAGWRLDLDGARAGVRGRCARLPPLPPAQPDRHGRSPREQLEAVAELCGAHGVLVIADEVHAPMTMPGADARALPLDRRRGRRVRDRDRLGVEGLEPRRAEVRA